MLINTDNRHGGTGGKIEHLSVDVSAIAIQIAELTQAVRELKVTVNQSPITVEVPDFDIPAPMVTVNQPAVDVQPQFNVPQAAAPMVSLATTYPLMPLVLIGIVNALSLLAFIGVQLLKH